uniref:C-type lectin domain-containing protein n=1 Tax=Labrus bergylta TaxID=56723 RepID=A0A3Q3FWF2_9LABR
MERILFTALILISVSSLSAKHVFIHFFKTWPDAQAYCRKHHTDLSPISNEVEYQMFRRLFFESSFWFEGWIGLYFNEKSPTKWSWSGGANATKTDRFSFDSHGRYTAGHKNGFYHTYRQDARFFCFNLMVDEVKKTWEEALEHCRETHTDLTSLNSETERLLALSEIQHDRITERVWIGLRFLGDHWLWVNGDPLVYEAWPEGDQEHQCPLRKRCGALTKEGHWENWDCEEKLHFICY